MLKIYADSEEKYVKTAVVFYNATDSKIYYDADFETVVPATDCMNLFLKGVVAQDANGDVYANAKESFAGGLVGHLDYNSKVKNSYSANAFIKTDTSSLSTGTNAIAYNGGLVGLSFGSIE